MVEEEETKEEKDEEEEGDEEKDEHEIRTLLSTPWNETERGREGRCPGRALGPLLTWDFSYSKLGFGCPNGSFSLGLILSFYWVLLSNDLHFSYES